MKQIKLYFGFLLSMLALMLNAQKETVFDKAFTNVCDTIIINGTTAYIDSASIDTINVDVCLGNTYTCADGTVIEVFWSSSSYISHTSILEGQATNGCDSLVIENIHTIIAGNSTHTIDVQICQGSSYTYVDGTVHDSIVESESHTSILEGQAANGCDSLVEEYISFFPLHIVDVSVCFGSSYTYLDGTVHDSIVENESHTSILEGQTINGCDSLVEEHLNVSLPYIVDTQICFGSSYTYLDGTVHDGIVKYESHVSILEGQTANGCDSLVEERVHFFNSLIHFVDTLICRGASYTYLDGTVHDSIVENESHISILEVQASNGCDSLVKEFVYCFGNPSYVIKDTICFGSSYTYLDGTIHDSIVENESHTSVLEGIQTTNGCDSLVIEKIYLSQYSFARGYVCWGDSYTFPDGTVHDNIIEDEVYICSLSGTNSNCYSIIFDLTAYEVTVDWTGFPNLSTDTIVAGDTLWLNGGTFGIDSVLIYQSESNPIPIPDGKASPYTSIISIGSGGVVESVDDIQEIGLNIEHSYVGDLDIQIKCPNGQTMAVLQFPNTCGSHHFGEPCDYWGTETETIGVGYDYIFTPDADSSLLDKVGLYYHDFIDNDGNSIGSKSYFPAGDYLPVGSFGSLIGCPIQGDWKLRILDNLGSDDGYVFNWHISFTNHYETFWGGDSVDNANSLSTFAIPNEGGLQTYTFSIEEANHCSYDTTLSVFVIGDINQGVDYQSKQKGIQIYPNPSQDFIYVKGVQKAICRIYNTNGMLIKEVQDVQKPIDVQELPKGVYLLYIQSNNGKQQFKLVKL